VKIKCEALCLDGKDLFNTALGSKKKYMIIQNAEREDHEMDKRESGEDGCMAQKFSTWGQKIYI